MSTTLSVTVTLRSAAMLTTPVPYACVTTGELRCLPHSRTCCPLASYAMPAQPASDASATAIAPNANPGVLVRISYLERANMIRGL
jgi:hypothetical protein